jgi:hypothetical protein
MHASRLIVVLSVVLVAGCVGKPALPPFKPVADIKTLMATVIDPAADAVWQAVGMILDEHGTTEWAPETDEEWAAVANGAMTLAEGGNLLMIGARARDQDTWMRMAEGMIDAGLAAYEAAQSKDPDAIVDVGGVIYDTCDRCHSEYWVGEEDLFRVRDENSQPNP